MQISLLHQMSVRCDNITQLEPAIPFDCVVEGKKLRATVTHVEDNGQQFIYRIRFSDGHAASFVAPMEAGQWLNESLASPYARAIADDLNAFCGFMPPKPPFCIRLKSETEAFNVWVLPHVLRNGQYSVYYKGDYRFDVRKVKTWEAKSVRENSDINQEIASIVCRNIDERKRLLLFGE